MSIQALVFVIILTIVIFIAIVFAYNIIKHGGRPIFDERNISSNTMPSFMKVKEGRFIVQSSMGKSFPLEGGYEEDLYEPFDCREKWGDLITGIYDQGTCGSCWAFSSCSAFSDRLRIKGSTNMIKTNISPYDMAACMKCSYKLAGGKWSKHNNNTTECPQVCEGNYMDDVLQYLVDIGGTPDSYAKETKYTCSHNEQYNLKAKRKYKVSKYSLEQLGTDPEKYKANELAIMQEIMENGPVCSIIIVFNPGNDANKNFYKYKAGVYGAGWTSIPQQNDGFHAINIIGWGTDMINNKPQKYWLVRNSWGSKHGMSGYFKIVRGRNACYIECDAWGMEA